jgi:hypothetical protein
MGFPVGITSMFVSVPLVGAFGLAVLLDGAILLGVGLWRRTIPVAGLVVALVVILLAAAPWLPFGHERLFSWPERTALPFIEQHAWIWTALFLFVLVPRSGCSLTGSPGVGGRPREAVAGAVGTRDGSHQGSW